MPFVARRAHASKRARERPVWVKAAWPGGKMEAGDE